MGVLAAGLPVGVVLGLLTAYPTIPLFAQATSAAADLVEAAVTGR